MSIANFFSVAVFPTMIVGAVALENGWNFFKKSESYKIRSEHIYATLNCQNRYNLENLPIENLKKMVLKILRP